MRLFRRIAWISRFCGLLALACLACAPTEVPPQRASGPTPAAPLISGMRLRVWDQGRCLAEIRVGTIRLVPKRWGPFRLADGWDVLLEDVCLDLKSNALASHLEEVLKNLLHLTRQSASCPRSGTAQGEAPGPEPAAALFLPPRVCARSFTCRVTYPEGGWLTLAAPELSKKAGRRFFLLEGGVTVTTDQGQLLQAESASWWPEAERLQVKGSGQLHPGSLGLAAPIRWLSLAGGRLKPLAAGEQPLEEEVSAALDLTENPFALFGGALGNPNNGVQLLSLLFFQTSSVAWPGAADAAPSPTDLSLPRLPPKKALDSLP
jgi:hypothetical protein